MFVDRILELAIWKNVMRHCDPSDKLRGEKQIYPPYHRITALLPTLLPSIAAASRDDFPPSQRSQC